MKTGKSSAKAKLILISNHIACQEDTPNRSQKVLKEADLIVFESEKSARQVLKYFKITRSFLIFSEHNETDSLDLIISAWGQNKTIAYMSDQGCPSLEDPGKELTSLAFSYKVTLEIIPGPSALTAALAACPFQAKSFLFAGFLPRKEKERTEKLKELKEKNELTFLMETPYRLAQVLESCQKVFGDSRQAFLALNASSSNETYVAASLKELSKKYSSEKKSLFVLALNSKEKSKKPRYR